MNISFQIPQEIIQLKEKLDNTERLLIQKSKESKSSVDELLTVHDTAKFLSLSVPTAYSLISKGAIPCMKRSKRAYFSRDEIIKYLKQGKKKTSSEIEAEADTFLATRKRKGGNRG